MKKTISLFVAALLLATVVLSACNQTAKPSEPGGLEDSVFDNPASSGGAQTPSSGTGAQNPTTGTQAPTTGGSQTPTTGSQPSNPTSVPTGPANPETKPSTSEEDDLMATMDFETFQNLSGDEQQKFQDLFESWEDFFGWYNAAKDAYEMENPPIEIGGDGEVDMGDLTGNGEN